MVSMRRALANAHGTALAAILLWGTAHSARAESCHVQAPERTDRGGLALGLGAELASFRTTRFEGNYEALIASGAWHHQWGQLRASLGAYRILANGLTAHGFGDLNLGVQSTLFRQPEGLGNVGVRLSVHAPTGAATSRLGMGHWMVMPGGWWQLGSAARYLILDVGYAAALASSSEHHHHDTGPIVAPMNPSEMNISIGAGLTVAPELQVRAAASLASPIGMPGTRRGEGCLAVDEHASRLRATLEACMPLMGDAFDWKVRSGVSWQF